MLMGSLALMRKLKNPDNQQEQHCRAQGADDEDAADAGGLGNQYADGGTQDIGQIASGVINPRGQTALDLVYPRPAPILQHWPR
jgi:hypothetical protein